MFLKAKAKKILIDSQKYSNLRHQVNYYPIINHRNHPFLIFNHNLKMFVYIFIKFM